MSAPLIVYTVMVVHPHPFPETFAQVDIVAGDDRSAALEWAARLDAVATRGALSWQQDSVWQHSVHVRCGASGKVTAWTIESAASREYHAGYGGEVKP